MGGCGGRVDSKPLNFSEIIYDNLLKNKEKFVPTINMSSCFNLDFFESDSYGNEKLEKSNTVIDSDYKFNILKSEIELMISLVNELDIRKESLQILAENDLRCFRVEVLYAENIPLKSCVANLSKENFFVKGILKSEEKELVLKTSSKTTSYPQFFQVLSWEKYNQDTYSEYENEKKKLFYISEDFDLKKHHKLIIELHKKISKKSSELLAKEELQCEQFFDQELSNLTLEMKIDNSELQKISKKPVFLHLRIQNIFDLKTLLKTQNDFVNPYIESLVKIYKNIVWTTDFTFLSREELSPYDNKQILCFRELKRSKDFSDIKVLQEKSYDFHGSPQTQKRYKNLIEIKNVMGKASTFE